MLEVLVDSDFGKTRWITRQGWVENACRNAVLCKDLKVKSDLSGEKMSLSIRTTRFWPKHRQADQSLLKESRESCSQTRQGCSAPRSVVVRRLCKMPTLMEPMCAQKKCMWMDGAVHAFPKPTTSAARSVENDGKKC